MRSLLLVFLGAGAGGVLRHYVNIFCSRTLGAEFPWGVFLINVTGSFAMGLAAGYFAFKSGPGWPQWLRLFLTTGVLGGYTTFSAFSLDAATLLERGDAVTAWLYVTGSVGLAILALFLGLSIMRAIS
ncbi:fluoride efflux transporter CrcB [Methylosinus sp. Sm6]|uniref:fluoride efflux transporter CrcB n=1 Tax=Methylosinus sp. Sm6 TaxID=2866948 RepID=UPI001C99FBDC|nr:fluoride efflux transporter CrcB [Methylosinus sp. Sm6]MBY6240673.1 fluoride efflux transporter CrcB [Methylosinus sp. Sm6]